MAYEIGDRVVLNESYTEWEPWFGLHGTVVGVNNPDMGGPPDRPYGVWLDGVRGSNGFFKESELDPE